MFEGVATATTCTHSTSTACTSLGRHCNTTHPSESSWHCERKILSHCLCRFSHVGGSIAASDAGVSTKTRIRDGSVLMDQRWLEWSSSSSPHSRSEIRERKSGISITLQQQKKFKAATDTLGLSGMIMFQTRHSGASIDRVRGFGTLQEVQRRGQWKAYRSVTRYDKSSRLEADYHSLPRPLRKETNHFGLAWLCARHEVWSQV